MYSMSVPAPRWLYIVGSGETLCRVPWLKRSQTETDQARHHGGTMGRGNANAKMLSAHLSTQ